MAAARAKAKDKAKIKHPARSPTAAIVARNQQIVLDREVDSMTWTAIGLKHKISERTARDGYAEYVGEIAPLVEYEEGFEKAREFLRVLEGVRQRFAEIASDKTQQTPARISAWREVVNTLMEEVNFRQAIGLLPDRLGDLKQVVERRWVAEQFIRLLDKYEVPEEAYVEFHEIMVTASGGEKVAA